MSCSPCQKWSQKKRWSLVVRSEFCAVYLLVALWWQFCWDLQNLSNSRWFWKLTCIYGFGIYEASSVKCNLSWVTLNPLMWNHKIKQGGANCAAFFCQVMKLTFHLLNQNCIASETWSWSRPTADQNNLIWHRENKWEFCLGPKHVLFLCRFSVFFDVHQIFFFN